MPYRMLLAALAVLLCRVSPAGAQTYAVQTDLLFYGDNTEFTNPFRSGETIFGTSGRVLFDVTLNDRVTVRGGLFGLGRFGAHQFLEHVEPAIALELSRGPSRLVFGSLHTASWDHDVPGPDLETPHGLLPPLQEETLTFVRGQEMGLQWLVGARRFEHDAWINWQRLNTAAHRERFDGGYRSALRVSSAWRLHGQWHVVHEGGQQFGTGPVSDSQAAALGVERTHPFRAARLSVEAHAVLSEHVHDRAQEVHGEVGLGVFSRVAVDYAAWRTHAIVWRGRDVLKDEGDANYLSRQRDGTLHRKVRDYAELGVTRRFRPAPGVDVLAAFRLHRIESHYEYSYRIVGRFHLRRVL